MVEKCYYQKQINYNKQKLGYNKITKENAKKKTYNKEISLLEISLSW